MGTWRNDPRYVKQREALKRQYKAKNIPCQACGQPFNWDLEDRRAHPDYWKHPLSFTADHIVAVNAGGKMAPGLNGLRGLHRGCNSRRGDGTREAAHEPVKQPHTSRQW